MVSLFTFSALSPAADAPFRLEMDPASHGSVNLRALHAPVGTLLVERADLLEPGGWRATQAHAILNPGTQDLGVQPTSSPAAFFRAESTSVRPRLARHVNATTGNDENDGLEPGSAFRTLRRALRDVPAVLAASYDILLAPGVYDGSVEIIRSGSASDLSPEDVLLTDPAALPLIRILGATNGVSTLRATAGSDSALRCMNVSVGLRNLTIEALGANGVSVSGGSLILENLTVRCDSASRHGVFCHRSTVYWGGTNSIRGPFAAGVALRTFSLARPGSHDLPQGMTLEIDGATQALFLRDFSTFTSTFNRATIRLRNVEYAVYAILGSNIFFTGGDGEVFLDVENVRTVFHLTHRSEANVNNMRLRGLRDHFCVGTLMSIVAIEAGIVPSGLVITNLDSSCLLRIPAAWSAITNIPR